MTQMARKKARKKEKKENINCSINLIALNEIKNSAVFQKLGAQRIRKRGKTLRFSRTHQMGHILMLQTHHTPGILFMAYLNMRRHNREEEKAWNPLGGRKTSKKTTENAGGGDKGAA